jgi:hypothetical protein
MSSFKKMIAVGATTLTLGAGAAVTAQAQPLTTPTVDRLSWEVTQAARNGQISWGEARELRGELQSVHELAWRNQSHELRPWEYRRLASTVHHVEARVSGYARNDGYRQYGYGYGYDHDHDGWRR